MSDLKQVGILARVDPICTLSHSRRKAFSDPLDPSATTVSSPTRSACTFLSFPPPPESHDLLQSCSSVWIFRSPARMSRRLSMLWSVWCELHLQITPAQPHRHFAPKPLSNPFRIFPFMGLFRWFDFLDFGLVFCFLDFGCCCWGWWWFDENVMRDQREKLR